MSSVKTYSVIDTEKTLLVTREGKNFKVVHLSSGKSKTLKASAFHGSDYKYPCDFIRCFCKEFSTDNVEVLQISVDANDLMLELIAFNRLDC